MDNEMDPENAENTFRVPEIPKRREGSKSPLKSINRKEEGRKEKEKHNDIESRKAAMLKRLESRRSAFVAKWSQEKNQPEKTATFSFHETEKSFIEQSFCEPARPSFSDISSIAGTDTFIVPNVPRKTSGPVCSTPRRIAKSPQRTFSPSTSYRSQTDYESQEEVTDRQFNALAVWCNKLLSTCNRFDDKILDLGQTKQEANKKLQEFLTKQGKEQQNVPEKFTIKDFFRAQEFSAIVKKAEQVFHSNDLPNKIEAMIKKKVVTIREESCIYSDIILKMKLLKVFLSFHPVWLHLGMETVFKTTITIPDEKSFIGTMSNFINTFLFSDPKIMKQKKYAIGTVKLLVTKEGRQALHRHFLTKTCQFLYCVERCKLEGIIQSDPRLFARKSQFKSLHDVFAEFSREILSASSTTLAKAFAKIGFQTTYKQTFFDDFDYKVEKPSDLADGVNLGKLVEISCNLSRGVVMGSLRNPGGDRLRKIGNVAFVLKIASASGIDIGDVKPETIVGGDKETILEVLWRIIGVFVLSSGNSEELRRESLRLHFSAGTSAVEKISAEDYLFRICQNLSMNFGLHINSLEDLRDGVLLSMVWREYNIGADDIHFFKGNTLFKKVVNAAETELDVPVGLYGSLPLFIHMFLTRLFAIRRVYDAATVIQRAYRAHQNSKTLKSNLKHLIVTHNVQKREEKERSKKEFEEKVIRLQSLCRRKIAMTAFRKRKAAKEAEILQQKEKNAVNLQRFWRGYRTRKAYQNLREEATRVQEEIRLRFEYEREQKAIVIQKSWRGYRARRIYKKLRLEKVQNLKKMLASVIRIQSTFRSFLARKKVQEFIREKEKQIELERAAELRRRIEEKAIILQKHWRGYQARQMYEKLRRLEKEKLIRSVVHLQSLFRCFLARKKLQGLIAQKKNLLEKEAEILRIREEKATILQRFWRGHQARRYYKNLRLERAAEAEKMKEAKKIESIVFIQSVFRRLLAAKKLHSLICEKNRQLQIERNVVIVQSRVRGFLARKRVNRMVTKKLEDLERSFTKFTETPPRKRYSLPLQNASTPELLKTLRDLRHQILKIKEFNVVCKTVLEGIDLQREVDESVRKENNVPTEKETIKADKKPEPSEEDKLKAALLIQRWWRGSSSRKRMQGDIDRRKKAMSDYKQNIVISDAMYDAIQQKRPVYEKLNEWTEWLFEKSLYRTKVAAISIDRVIKLADMVAKYFIFGCNGFSAILDRMEQTDRSPGEEEIMTSLTSILCRIIEKATTDNNIKKVVLKYEKDCLKILFHFINAYHGNSSIVLTSAKALQGLKILSSAISYEKAKFFINQAEKRYKRLPQNDPKCMALRILQKHFQ